MIAASLYILVCSSRNRLRVRLRRLREPRYLAGAIAGAAYLYFSIFARFGRGQRPALRRPRNPAVPTAAMVAASGPSLVALALMALAAFAWILPLDSGLLDFSQAEVQFLFTAPISRRALLLHRLIRSQFGLLFGAVVLGIVMPSTSPSMRVGASVAMWLLLCTGKLYFTGVTLARARLTSPDRRTLRMAWLPLAAVAAAVLTVGIPLVRTLLAEPLHGARDVLARIGVATSGGVPRIVMWPFLALARPFFADSPRAALTSLTAAAAVFAAAALWAIQSDAAFEDAAEQTVHRGTPGQAAAAARYKVRGDAWRLAAIGPVETALMWKAATQTVRSVNRRLILRMAILIAAFTMVVGSGGRIPSIWSVVAASAVVTSIFMVLMAPQAVRLDLRDDLQHVELLKTWPVAAPSVVRGELLWPGLLIVAIVWLAIAVALATSGALFATIEITQRFWVAVAGAVLAPPLVFAQLLLHNAAALMFPAWVPLGSQRPRGLDAMGQRLIMLGGTWVALILITVPGAIAGVLAWFVFSRVVGSVAVALGAFVCAAALVVEVFAATEIVAPLYEKLDLSAVERVE